MSLLQEHIIYILLVPVVLQIVIPLAMLILYTVISPIYSIFKSKQLSERMVDEELFSTESMA
jgi:hypothetical protein